MDIGSKTIKVTELIKSSSKWSLRASGVVGYTGSPVERIKTDKEQVALASAIKVLFREAKISSKEVTLSLPESEVYTRLVKFPLLTDSEIASAVKWEAEQYIPISIDEAIIQHQVVERREDTSPPTTLVLLVAAPRLLVEKYVMIVERAGLKSYAVETELISLVRSLAPPNRTVMIVDFGARSTDMAISRKGQLTFSRSVTAAGEAFTRAVARGLGVNEQQAEEYKKAYGFSSNQLEGKIKSSLEPVIRMIADEVKKAIHFYKSGEEGSTPDSIILAGGTAGMPEMGTAIAEMLGIEVVVGNPFTKIVVNPQAAKSLASHAPLYSVSVGLAMRED